MQFETGTMNRKRIGFIGAGRMALALAEGFRQKNVVTPDCLMASDVSAEARERFRAATGASVTADNLEVLRRQEVIFLAVKPQYMDGVLRELAGRVSADRLIVSIAAGVSLARLEAALGKDCRVVRVMPNTPCLVGQGASGYALGSQANDEDGHLVGELLSAVGVAVRVEERFMDAVTAVSGSGPAFAYVMIEAMADAGVRHGLPRETAQILAAQTLKGAAEMVLATGSPPSVLKEQVTSPGGTTIAGLAAMESAGFRAAVFAAVQAAAERSAQLGG